MALFNGERVYPEVSQFLPVQNGRVPVEVTEGGMWYDLSARAFKAIISGVPMLVSNGNGLQLIAKGTAILGTSLIASGAAAPIVSVAAAGALATDNVLADFSVDPTGTVGYEPSASGMLTILKFCTAGFVNFYAINNTASSITPGAITLNWRVVR